MKARYIYVVDNLDSSHIGSAYFSSYRKAIAYAKAHGYTSCTYSSGWVTDMRIPEHDKRDPFPYDTHVSVYKIELR